MPHMLLCGNPSVRQRSHHQLSKSLPPAKEGNMRSGRFAAHPVQEAEDASGFFEGHRD